VNIVEKIARSLGYARIRRRSWSAAAQTRLTGTWSSAPVPVQRDIRTELKILRARSREQFQNNDYVRRFINMVAMNIVGHSGVAFQAKTIGIGNEPDEPANNALESAWVDWGRPQTCDIAERTSWRSAQRLIAQSVARDGEAFVRLRRDANMQRNPYGFSIQMIDPELVDVALNREKSTRGNEIVSGVEIDGVGRAVAYYVLSKSPGSETYAKFDGTGYIRVPADEMLHIYLPEWVNGFRGIPWVASSLYRLQMLNGYEEAELVAARTAASKMGFFVETDGGEYIGDGEDASGNLIADAAPGQFERLPSGVTFQSYDPQHPNQAYPDFVKSCLRGIASGLGVSYNALSNDLEGVNYSSLRQGALDERGMWMMLQDWLIESLHDRVYRVWLSRALELGAIKINGMPLKPERFDKYMQVSWQPRRWQWVDPAKEMQANRDGVELGIVSRSEIIRERGRDPEDVWREIERERKRMSDLGIPLDEPVETGAFSEQDDED